MTGVVVIVAAAVSSLIQETLQTPERGEYFSSNSWGNKALGSETIREYYSVVCVICGSVDGNRAPLPP